MIGTVNISKNERINFFAMEGRFTQFIIFEIELLTPLFCYISNIGFF